MTTTIVEFIRTLYKLFPFGNNYYYNVLRRTDCLTIERNITKAFILDGDMPKDMPSVAKWTEKDLHDVVHLIVSNECIYIMYISYTLHCK